MTSDFDIDSILKDSDEMMANMRGQKFKPSEKSAATQQPHELDKYLVDADEMMGNLHGQKPKKENSPEHVESFRDTLFPEGGWGVRKGLESALGPEKRPETVAAALHQIGFGNINEQQKAIADSVTDPTEIAEFPAWHEKTPEQKEIAYQHSKKEYTAGDLVDTAKGALVSLGGLAESAVMGAGKAVYDLGPGVAEMNLRMASAHSDEEKKRIENEYSQRFANVFRSVPEAFGNVGHELGSIVEYGKAAGFPMVDRLAAKFGMMSDDTRREHFMVRDALKTHDAQVSAQNPSMTGRMSKAAYKAIIDWTGPSIDDILHMHPEFKGDRERAKAFKDKESEKKADEALGQWINEMNTHPVDPDVMTLPTLIPLAEGLPAANTFAFGEKLAAGALDLGTAARRVASGMTRAEWGAAQLAKAEAKLAESAAKASELGRVGRAAGYLAGKGEQAIQAGEQALGKVEQAGEAAKAEYDRIFENAPEKMRGYLEKSMPVLGAAGVGGAIGALADPESELKGAAKGALFGAAALQVPRLAYDIARASAKNAGGTAGVFGTLAKDADSGWGARMLVGNGIPPQGGNWMQTMLARRPQVFDWMVNNTKDMANSAIHITPMAVTLGMLDSNDPKGFVDSMLQGWAWAVGPQLYHKALGKDPFQSARERKQYDHQAFKFKSSLSEDTLKRMNHFADIGTEVKSAKDHLDLVTRDYQKATEGKEKGAEMTPEEQVHGILVAKARLRYEAALRNASTPEGKDEYAKQFWYRMADIDAHISGAIEPGKNVKVELMTTDDMLDKLGKSNMKGFEALGGPVPSKPLSQWGPEELNTLSPQQQAYYQKLKFFSEAEGVNYLRSHTRVHNGERIDKQNGKHVIWEPEMEKGTVALNADVIFDNMLKNGDAFLSVYSHEMGHALDGFDEHKKRSATLRKRLFGEEMKDANGNTIGQIPGLYDDKHLFDLFQTKYGKSNANLTPEQVAEKMGLYDPDTNAYNVKGIVDMMKDEVMADMNSTGFYRNYFFNRPKGAAALVDWMTVKDQNSKLSKLARRMAGLQPDAPAWGERSGAMFTPEVQRMADQHMREMRALHGDMMPHNPEETIVPPVDKKDIIANKELSDYYLTDTGRFKTEMAGIVYDAAGNKVAEIVLQDPNVNEGSWFHHTNEAGESSFSQGHGDGEMPPELAQIPIPMGGHAMSTHRLMRDPSGKPIENDNKATRELIQLRAQMIRDAIDASGDLGAPGRLRPVSPGSNSYRGQLTDAQMEAIRRLPNRVVPYSIKQKLFDINKSLAKNDGTRLLLDYATRIDAKGNYVPFSPKIVDVVPIGMMFSTDGHFLMTGVSVSRMMSKLDRWEAFMPARLKPWNGSKNKFMEEIVGSYLENHSKGHPGSGYAEDGTPVEGAKKLAPTQAEAEAKRDIFNDFFNMYDSSTVDRNPDRTELPALKLTREQRKEDNLVKLTKEAKKLEKSSNQNTMVRSFRLDSIMDMAVSDLVKIPVDYYKVKMNASLEARAREEEQRPRLEAIPDLLSRMNMRYAPRTGEAAEPRFSVLSREPARMDAEYTAAHELRDEESAKRLVNEAAKKAGVLSDSEGAPIPFFHGSAHSVHNIFDRFKSPAGGDKQNKGYGMDSIGSWFTTSKNQGRQYGRTPEEGGMRDPKRLYETYLDFKNPFEFNSSEHFFNFLENLASYSAIDKTSEALLKRGRHILGALNSEMLRESLLSTGRDGIIIRSSDADGRFGLDAGENLPTWAIALEPNQIKSADPFTYDDAGDLIPLSQRFNSNTGDIRFSISRPDRGININDGGQDFTGQILRGEKTVETRDQDRSLAPYVGKRVGIISTGKGPATLRGYADIGEPVEYKTPEEFRAAQSAHLVGEGSKYDIKPGMSKYGFPLSNVEELPEPKRVPVSGRVASDLSNIRFSLTSGAEDSVAKAKELRDWVDSKMPAQQKLPHEDIAQFVRLDNAMQIAGGSRWQTGRDLKQALQDKTVEMAQARGIDFERGLEHLFAQAKQDSEIKAGTKAGQKGELPDTEESAQLKEYLKQVGLRDALFALKQNPNAIGWYDEKTKQAIALMGLIHPEILQDENARMIFTWALAVTSNGLKVGKNFQLAERAYSEFKRTGEMPTNIGTGTAKEAIDGKLADFNTLQKAWGHDNLRKFLLTDWMVGEINKLGADDKGIEVGGEWATENVKGAAILGPKIGNGFFSNLYGNFDALTMDRWLVRTWGRWTGTLLQYDHKKIDGQYKRLELARSRLSDRQKEGISEIVGSNIMDMTVNELGDAIKKASIKPEKREAISKLSDEIRLAGNGLANARDGQKEAPGGPDERIIIRSTFGDVLSELRKMPEYKDLTMADLQAVLWYAEKRLYENAKVNPEMDDSGTEGYEDSEAPDYANAAAAVARLKGIQQAVSRQAKGITIDNVSDLLDFKERLDVEIPQEVRAKLAENPKFTALGKAEQKAMLEKQIAARRERVTRPPFAEALPGILRVEKQISQKIDQERQRITNGLATGTRPTDDAGDQAGSQQQTSAGGFAGKERGQFVKDVAVGQLRFNRSQSESSGWAYDGGSGSGAKGSRIYVEPPTAAKKADLARTQKNLGAPILAAVEPGSKLKNLWSKADIPAPTLYELDSKNEIAAAKFKELIAQSKVGNRFGACVDEKSVEDYQGMRLFVTGDGKAGVGVKPDGDIVSVFAEQNVGYGHALIETAIAMGGTKLDCFDTILPAFYSKHGFKAIARTPFNEKFAPEGWDKASYAKFKNGSPDIVFMALDPGARSSLYNKADGKIISDWDEGVRMQTKAVKKFQSQYESDKAAGEFIPRAEKEKAKKDAIKASRKMALAELNAKSVEAPAPASEPNEGILETAEPITQ